VHDLIILGGGPAGLTAAVYAISKRLDVLLLSENLGGKTNHRMRLRGMEGFEHVTGEEVVRRFRGQIEYMDHISRMEKVVAIEALAATPGRTRFAVVTASGEKIEGRALIVATGANPTHLNVPGEQEYIGRGVSYSAVSHAPLFWGRDAAVVGSGRLALRGAAELATVANHVYLVAPDTATGDSVLRTTSAATENVTELTGYTLTAVRGMEHVTEMSVRAPDGEERGIPVQGVFIELGLVPNSAFLGGLVDLTPDGFVRVDNRGATSRPGIFAAGDVADSYAEQVLIAVGDGAKAALAAYEHLLGQPRAPAEVAGEA